MLPINVLFYDRSGLFVHLAERLVGMVAGLRYYSEWRDSSLVSKGKLIGEGVFGIERSTEFFKDLGWADLVIFPDVGNADLQAFIRRGGTEVFGTGDLERLETDKIFFQDWLYVAGLEVPESWMIEGFPTLEGFLQTNEDLYLKSNDRGDFETFHHKRWEITEPWFKDLQVRLGPYSNDVKLVVQKPVEGIEVGYDGFIIDGRFPSTGVFGIECKDAGYIGRVCDYPNLPSPLRDVNEKITDWVESGGLVARGAFSSEVRIGRDGFWFIDATCRFPSPPSESVGYSIGNLADVFYGIAQGNTGVEVEYTKGPYIAQIQLLSDWTTDKRFLAVRYPEDFRQNLAWHFHYVYDNVDYIVPGDRADIVGSACGYGDTPEEAMDQAVEVAESVESHDITFNKHIKDECSKAIQEFVDLGYDF